MGTGACCTTPFFVSPTGVRFQFGTVSSVAALTRGASTGCESGSLVVVLTLLPFLAFAALALAMLYH